MEKRGGHFMPVELLRSQFADLEFPEDALIVDIQHSPENIIDSIINKIS